MKEPSHLANQDHQDDQGTHHHKDPAKTKKNYQAVAHIFDVADELDIWVTRAPGDTIIDLLKHLHGEIEDAIKLHTKAKAKTERLMHSLDPDRHPHPPKTHSETGHDAHE